MPRIQQRGTVEIVQQPDNGATTQQPQRIEAWCLDLPKLPSFPHSSPIASLSGQGLPDALKWATSLFGGSEQALETEVRAVSQATRLRSALTSYNALSPDWKAAILGVVLSSGGLLSSASQLLSPTGPGGCDHNMFERCANCATSAPYVMVGVHAIKNRRTAAGKAWGASMCAVGMASTAFHASSGDLRPYTRRMDYWSIALASNLLTRAVYPDTPVALTAAGMLLTPFKPFLVSFLNSSAMELKFMQRAWQRPELRRAQQIHATTCLMGLGAFALEEFCPRLPLVHAAWHCLSATAVATVNHLLDDVEQHNAQRRASKQLLLLTDKCTPLIA